MLIGLTGRMGAGKDTVYARLQVLTPYHTVVRKAFADPLKNSVCALFGITREQLEDMKNNSFASVTLLNYGPALVAKETVLAFGFSMREFLQRYGTEAHRGIFGENFWLDATLPLKSPTDPYVPGITVITDCRFPNEAERIRQCGGRVFEVIGLEGLMSETAAHPSERALPARLLDGYIYNSHRDDGFASLDAEIRRTISCSSVPTPPVS